MIKLAQLIHSFETNFLQQYGTRFYPFTPCIVGIQMLPQRFECALERQGDAYLDTQHSLTNNMPSGRGILSSNTWRLARKFALATLKWSSKIWPSNQMRQCLSTIAGTAHQKACIFSWCRLNRRYLINEISISGTRNKTHNSHGLDQQTVQIVDRYAINQILLVRLWF